ncbi:MAG: response regulator [Phycisphaerae bacterium]
MKRYNILVVDDNQDNLDLIHHALPEEEFKVFTVRSGCEAMTLLLSQPMDMVLLDLMMPDMNGFATLQMIRFIPRLMEIPVVIQTAYGNEINRRRLGYMGVKMVLVKPLSPSVLVEQIKGILCRDETNTSTTETEETVAVSKGIQDARERAHC